MISENENWDNGQAETKKQVLLVTRQWRGEETEGVIGYYESFQLRNTPVESHYHTKYTSMI